MLSPCVAVRALTRLETFGSDQIRRGEVALAHKELIENRQPECSADSDGGSWQIGPSSCLSLHLRLLVMRRVGLIEP